LTVLDCTLWERLDPDEFGILRWSVTDFNCIGGLTLDVYQALHAHDAEWLENSIAQIARDEPQRKIVVMTHHAPTRQSTSDPKYDGRPNNSAFATEMVGGVGIGVDFWSHSLEL
jgi:hypothetical protein